MDEDLAERLVDELAETRRHFDGAFETLDSELREEIGESRRPSDVVAEGVSSLSASQERFREEMTELRSMIRPPTPSSIAASRP